MRRIRFGDFEVDLDLFSLRRNGTELDIGQRTFDLLICLIENRERVVDPDFLRREVWGSAALSPAAIPTCVMELRKTLGDSASQPKFVASIRGRGYRFIAQLVSDLSSIRKNTLPLEDLPFVGRMAEMAILRESVKSTVAEARGHLVLIRGEAGMGKTRLLSEFIETIPPTIPTYVSRSSSIEGSPAFWPWTQILRDALAAQKDINQELIDNARSLSTAFPEIQRSVALKSDRPPNLDRFSILSRWTTTIRCMSRGAPLVLAFEDIHLADFDSISLLSWIAEELSFDPVTVIATHRPHAENKATAAGLTALAGLSQCKHVDLSPLTAIDIKSMLDPLSANKAELSEELRTRTAGNAFYVTHLIRYLDIHSKPDSTELIFSELPSDGQAIVSRQLSDLPEITSDALAVASVWGGTFPILSTAEALGISSTELMTQLEPARSALLIREDGEDFVFSHAILQEALYQTLDLAQRRKLHFKLAKILIRRGDAHVALISDHLNAAMPLADHEEVREFAILAGRDAATRFAYAEAQVFFRRAVASIELASGCSTTEHCRVILEYATSQLYAGDRQQARQSLLAAAELARATPNAELLAECALQLAPDFLSIEIGAYDPQLISMLQESLLGLPKNMKPTRSLLLARLSHALLWSKDVLSSEKLAIEALHLAHESDNVVSLSAALAARADSLTGPDRLEEKIDITRQLEQTVRAQNNLPDTVMQHVRLISTLLEIGDIRAVDSEIESCERIAKEMNLPQYSWYTKTFRAMRTLMRGDFTETHRLARESHELGGRYGDENVPHSRACQTACILIEQNNAAAALPTISAMSAKRPLVRSWAAGTGYIHLMAGQTTEALNLLGTFDDREVNLLFRETGGSAGIAFLAEIAASGEDQSRKSLLLELCSQAPDRGATLGFAIAYFGCFSRYAGILAHSLGQMDQAIEYLRIAIDIESKRGALLYKAHAELDLANVLFDSGHKGEVRQLLVSVHSVCVNSPFLRLSERHNCLATRSENFQTVN
jgi:DNA-binding winged helix-turn-helix (wHTH) protein/tetratricopeptide (TPR) repeat protein